MYDEETPNTPQEHAKVMNDMKILATLKKKINKNKTVLAKYGITDAFYDKYGLVKQWSVRFAFGDHYNDSDDEVKVSNYVDYDLRGEEGQGENCLAIVDLLVNGANQYDNWSKIYDIIESYAVEIGFMSEDYVKLIDGGVELHMGDTGLGDAEERLGDFIKLYQETGKDNKGRKVYILKFDNIQELETMLDFVAD